MPAAMADPLRAFAERAGLRQRSLQSGLKLLKGKVSGTVHPGLQPAHCAVPDQLARQPRHVLEEVPQGKHQKQNIAGDLQQFKVDKQSHAKTRNIANPQVADAQLLNSDMDGIHSKLGAPHHRKPIFSPKQPPPDVPTATNIDPTHFHKLKQSLCQLMQDRHAVELPTDPTSAERPLIALLASKLDGVDITAALVQHRNVLPGAQQHRHDAAGNADDAVEVSSASRSSVACTPSPEVVPQLRANRELQSMPGHAASAVQYGTAVEAPLSLAHHASFSHLNSSSSISSGFNRMPARQRREPQVEKPEHLRQLPCFSSFAHTASISPDMLHDRHDWQQYDAVSDGNSDPDGSYQQHMQLAAPFAKLSRCTFNLCSNLCLSCLYSHSCCSCLELLLDSQLQGKSRHGNSQHLCLQTCVNTSVCSLQFRAELGASRL